MERDRRLFESEAEPAVTLAQISTFHQYALGRFESEFRANCETASYVGLMDTVTGIQNAGLMIRKLRICESARERVVHIKTTYGHVFFATCRNIEI